MNEEIMSEYTHKISKMEEISTLSQKVDELKEKKKDSMFRKLNVEGKFNRLAERLVYLATHPFDGDVNKELRNLIDGDIEEEHINSLDEEKEKQRREG